MPDGSPIDECCKKAHGAGDTHSGVVDDCKEDSAIIQNRYLTCTNYEKL